MIKTININVLLKDNMIVCYHISPNKRTMPHDYYKDFFYAGESMEDCDKKYKVEWIAIQFEYNEDEESSSLNNYIFEEIAKTFFKRWKIHPKHWGSPAY